MDSRRLAGSVAFELAHGAVAQHGGVLVLELETRDHLPSHPLYSPHIAPHA
eukprot:COSAG01_NODE_1466_length_10220_cov_15.883608_13_plen_51_part_00